MLVLRKNHNCKMSNEVGKLVYEGTKIVSNHDDEVYGKLRHFNIVVVPIYKSYFGDKFIFFSCTE